ncbi:MAG TPA: hypothetical protein VHP58_00875 [Alphaproteobacteria bacterium]|nr:hypothetical protein [Alphaproteobacteria bacterium]
MKTYLLAAATALLTLGAAGTALAQNQWHGGTHFRGHDWDPPAGHQWKRIPPGQAKKRLYYAPRHNVAVREYVYYPQARAYYAPWNKRWYYRNGNRWVVRQSAPLNINLGNGINISLGADVPYTYDTYVVNNYRTYYPY